METVLAERKLIAVSKKTGVRSAITLRIGIPTPSENRSYICPVEIDGLYPNMAFASGGDSFQALEHAIGREVLIRKKSHEYDFYWSDDGSHYFDENAPSIEIRKYVEKLE